MGSALAISPRGLSRENAAAYIGVSPGLFDQMVKDGRMPAARVINTRKVYDLHELDDHFDRLPYSVQSDPDGNESESNPLDAVEAI